MRRSSRFLGLLHDAAIQSAQLGATSRSARSLGVSAEMGSTTLGVLTPLRFEILPGTSTWHAMYSSPFSTTVCTFVVDQQRVAGATPR